MEANRIFGQPHQTHISNIGPCLGGRRLQCRQPALVAALDVAGMAVAFRLAIGLPGRGVLLNYT